ncbi:hypothetical protein CPC08DRAFT_649584 [Agrocybe pediades]|nr:hypothetical protein CPC08DRAFT_649584 [Agrocybe pediades]
MSSSSAPNTTQEVDPVQLLFLHCGSVLREARFILESLPNAEKEAVERILRQLHSVHKILEDLEDPSIHNVRIERLWRDVRRDTLEFFRTLFLHLEAIGLLDMENPIQRVCLFLTYENRIQSSLDTTVASWNLHKVRTAGNKTPLALYQISREEAINRGYWTGDPGDDITNVGEDYGRDLHESFPPADELAEDPSEPSYRKMTREEEREAGIFVDDDEEIAEARELLKGLDFERDDGNFGIDVYCEAVSRLTALACGESDQSEHEE